MENFEKEEGGFAAAEASYQAEDNNFYSPNNNSYAPGGYSSYIPYGFTPNTLNEKKDIRKRALAIGFPCLIMFAISFLWATVYYAVMSVFGIGQGEAYKIISEPAVMSIAQILLSIFMFTLPFVLNAMAAGFRISDLVALNRPKKGSVLPYFLFGIAFCAFANIAVSYAGNIFSSFGIDYSVDFGENPEGFFGFILSLISTVAVPALVEEFTCRGIIFGILKKYGNAFALIISSLIFGVMHGNFTQIPFAFLVGLVLGFIRIKTDSLIVCCLVHAFNNFVSVVFDYFGDFISVALQNILYTVFLLLCLLGGIIGVWLMAKEGGGCYKIEETEHTECTEKQKYKWFLTSPVIIIFLCLFVLESCLYFVI